MTPNCDPREARPWLGLSPSGYKRARPAHDDRGRVEPGRCSGCGFCGTFPGEAAGYGRSGETWTGLRKGSRAAARSKARTTVWDSADPWRSSPGAQTGPIGDPGDNEDIGAAWVHVQEVSTSCPAAGGAFFSRGRRSGGSSSACRAKRKQRGLPRPWDRGSATVQRSG